MQAYEDQVSLVRIAQAQVEACEDELNSRAAELDALQVTTTHVQRFQDILAWWFLLLTKWAANVGVSEFLGFVSCRMICKYDNAVQAGLAEAEAGRSEAVAQTAAVREQCKQSLAAVQAEAQAAAARARKEADAEIGAAHAEGAAAAVRARQEADSAIADVRAGAEAAAARAKQEADSSTALIRWQSG